MTAACYWQLEAVNMQPKVEGVGKKPNKAVLLQARGVEGGADV